MKVSGQLEEAGLELLTADPANKPEGRAWINLTSKKIKIVLDGVVREISISTISEDNKIVTNQITDLAVTNDKIANGAVGTTKIANQSITSALLHADLYSKIYEKPFVKQFVESVTVPKGAGPIFPIVEVGNVTIASKGVPISVSLETAKYPTGGSFGMAQGFYFTASGANTTFLNVQCVITRENLTAATAEEPIAQIPFTFAYQTTGIYAVTLPNVISYIDDAPPVGNMKYRFKIVTSSNGASQVGHVNVIAREL